VSNDSVSADIAKSIISSNPDLKGFYGANEGSAIGIVKGVEESGIRRLDRPRRGRRRLRILPRHVERVDRIDDAKAERAQWERRVALLKSDSLDADMLDERARALLNYADPHDLVLMKPHP